MFEIFDSIGSLLSSLFDWIFENLLQPLIMWFAEKIFLPIMTGVIEFVKCIVCNMFYNISIFILRMIDFVELLFRSLADLPSKEMAGFGLELSLNGQKGNILLQLLKSGSVQGAFLAMCIVGLFLIVVMTAFQIIKIEYTTEGAKNAKGPIFYKAFRGVAILLLMPILVVFGIVFSNQLLNLLDIATSSNASSTISGQVFATSVSEAHYLEGELKYEFGEGANGPIARQLQSLMLAYVSFADTLIDHITGENDKTDSYVSYEIADAQERANIDNSFASQSPGYKYYLMSDVSKYYKYTEINYLILILSGSLILKTLCFACFGLVIRLYKVSVLFIISPAIIGMSVLNEKSLGGWRKAFIGQVLAAYGVVIAINLFFIIVNVLLNVELNFVPAGGGSESFGLLSSTLMTQLLRLIIVISGAVLIEKFSKEIGQFFGADDLLAPGQELAKKGLDTLKKVAVEVAAVAATVFTGAGGAAIKAGSAAMKAGAAVGKAAGKLAGKGIANSVGKNAAKNAAKKSAQNTAKKGAQNTAKKGVDSAKKAADGAGQNKGGKATPDDKEQKPNTGEEKPTEEAPQNEGAEAAEGTEGQGATEENAQGQANDGAENQEGDSTEAGEESESDDGEEQSGEENADSEGESSDETEEDESNDEEDDLSDYEEDEDIAAIMDEVPDLMDIGITTLDDSFMVDSFIRGAYKEYSKAGGTMEKEAFEASMKKSIKKRANQARKKPVRKALNTAARGAKKVKGFVNKYTKPVKVKMAQNTLNTMSLFYGFTQGSHLTKMINRHSDLVGKGAKSLGEDTFGQAYENAKYKRGQKLQKTAEAIFQRSVDAYESPGAMKFADQVLKKAKVETARLPITAERILEGNRQAFRNYRDEDDKRDLILQTVDELKSAGIMMDFGQVMKYLQSQGEIKISASDIGAKLDIEALRGAIAEAYLNNGHVDDAKLARVFADAIGSQVGNTGSVEMAALMIKLVNETLGESN